MRIHIPRLLAVLDPEATRQRRMGAASPIGSARSTGSGRQDVGRDGEGVPRQRPAAAVPESARLGARPPPAKSEDEEPPTAFDLLHTERGFNAFEAWYRRVLASGAGASAPPAPRPELGLLWPQAFCPPSALHEHAFVELLRVFAECAESEAFDFFDLLDYRFLGMLGLPQIYLAVCLIAALGSRQLTKFLYFHSNRLFEMLAEGCVDAAPERVSWPRVLMLLRLLGAPGHLVSRVAEENHVENLAQLNYDEFVEVLFPIMVQLDRGAEFGESTVIHENYKVGHVRQSRMCTIL